MDRLQAEIQKDRGTQQAAKQKALELPYNSPPPLRRVLTRTESVYKWLGIMDNQTIKTEVGDLCCALREMDQMWYSAEVMEVMSNSQLKVFFMDHGNTETVTTANIRPIPENLQCKLAGSAKKSCEQTVSRVQPPTSGRFDVVLRCVRSPGLFYCQLTEPSGVQELQMLLKEITHHCQGQPMDPTYYPDIGEICCVKSPDGRNWLRAEVQEHRMSNKVQIECVDIGKQVLVSPTRLRPALPQHTVLPLQVFKASLARMVLFHGGGWCTTALLASFVDSQRLTAEVVGQEGDRYFLDLWDCSSKPERSLSMMLAVEPQSPEGSPPPSRKLSQKSSQPQATHPPPVQNGHVLSPSPVEVIQNGGLERASSHKAPPTASVGTAGGADMLSAQRMANLQPEWQEMKDMIAKSQQLVSRCMRAVVLLSEKMRKEAELKKS